jgi:riboflavin synthase
VFTGIVEAVGTVVAAYHGDGGRRLAVATPLAADLALGESVAIDGVCLTVADRDDDRFAADVVAETLDRCTLGARRPGEIVNLERAATLRTRLSGHLVQGHVDGVATVLDRVADTGGETVRISLPTELSSYVVEKGSIAVDGISLTVVRPEPGRFTVALVPTTLAGTTLGGKRPGAKVNLEVDVIAKYVERRLAGQADRGGAGAAT